MSLANLENLFDRVKIERAVSQMYPVRMGLQSLFFPKQFPATSTKYVEFHIKKGSQTISNYKRRGEEPTKINAVGYEKRIEEPPLIFNQTTTDADDFFKAQFGENIYSSTSPMRNAEMKLAQDFIQLKEVQQRNILKQVADVLINGTSTFDYANGTSPTIDWNRPAGNSASAGEAWSDSTSCDPDNDIIVLAEKIRQASGFQRIVVVMNEATKIKYMASAKVQETRDKANYYLGMVNTTTRESVNGLRRIATVEDMPIYTFNEIYIDTVGTNPKTYIPDDKVIIASPDAQVGIHYAGLSAVIDNGRQVQRGIFPQQELAYMYLNRHNESWEARYKSAPLVAMTQADAFGVLDVS
jgi:hypothetical protein